MKLTKILSIFVVAFATMLSLTSCDNDAPNSPWKFDIVGKWHCYYGFDDYGTVTFEADGKGVCVAPDAPTETGAPFTYTYTRHKDELQGKLVITSTADPADYPDLDPNCIAFRPGVYGMSPDTTEGGVILIGDQIQWRIQAFSAVPE